MLNLAEIDVAAWAKDYMNYMWMENVEQPTSSHIHIRDSIEERFGIESIMDWHELRAVAADLGLIPAEMHSRYNTIADTINSVDVIKKWFPGRKWYNEKGK